MLRFIHVLLLAVVPTLFVLADIHQKNVTMTGHLYCDHTFVGDSFLFFDVKLVQQDRVLASKRVQDWRDFEITGTYFDPVHWPMRFFPPYLQVDGDCYGSKSKRFELNGLPHSESVDLGYVVLNNRS